MNRNLVLIIVGWLVTVVIGSHYRDEAAKASHNNNLLNLEIQLLEERLETCEFKAIMCECDLGRNVTQKPEATLETEGVPHREKHVPTALDYGDIYMLTGTVYNAVPGQTDDSPLVTADNSRIDLHELNSGNLRWCALSRDLLSRWDGPFNYGDLIMVEGAGHMAGIWAVHDTMNKRYTSYIDFLVPEHIKLGKWENVSIRLVK